MNGEGEDQRNPSRSGAEQSVAGEGVSAGHEQRTWIQDLRLTTQELADVIPAGATYILVDDQKLDSLPHLGRCRLPFLERDGQAWGAPANDEEAIRELERLREAGAGHMAFAWPAFWWLEHYEGMHQYLQSRFRCVLHNERLVVFDLRNARTSKPSNFAL